MDLNRAEFLALNAMHEHGISARFVWTESLWRNAEAFVSFNGQFDELRLSRPLTEVRTEAEVANSILHEIAHLLSRDPNHDAAFIAKARELGVKPNEGSKTLVMALASKAQRV